MPSRVFFTACLLAALAVPALAAATPAGRWRVVEIFAEAVAPSVETTFDLGADGTVSGEGGCNRYGGSATVTAGRIAFGPMMGTRMACAQPAMAQDDGFHRALSSTVAWRFDGDTLVFADSAGKPMVRLKPR